MEVSSVEGKPAFKYIWNICTYTDILHFRQIHNIHTCRKVRDTPSPMQVFAPPFQAQWGMFTECSTENCIKRQ